MSRPEDRDYKHEYALAKKRGENGTGHNSGDAKRKRARRAKEKLIGRKLRPDEHVDHKKPIKKGGGNAPDNLAIKPASINLANGGKLGHKGKGVYKR